MLLALGASSSLAEEQWGNVTMRFVLDGDAKPPAPVKIERDPKICGEEVFDESLLVNPKDRGIANVIVWLVPQKAEDVPVHPDYEKSRDAEVILQVKGCRYEPRVVLLRTTQTLVWKTVDPIGHNPSWNLMNNPRNSDLIPASGHIRKQLLNAELEPAKTECSIHPWMSAWLLVRDNPYMAVSDKSGNLKLANIPAGKRTFYFWHERHWLLSDLAIGEAGKTRRGRLTLDFAEGENDLGEVRVPESMLEMRGR
jgi:hypothetical protein